MNTETFFETILAVEHSGKSAGEHGSCNSGESAGRRRCDIPLLSEHFERYKRTVRHFSSTPFSGSFPHSSSSGLLSLEDFATCIRGAVKNAEESMDAVRSTVGNYISIPSKKMRVRLAYTAQGEITQCSALPFVRRRFERIACIEVPQAHYAFKSENRALFESLLSAYPQYDEIVILKQGRISDGCRTNIYIRTAKNLLLTPCDNLLAGCRRESLIAQGRLKPRPLRWSELYPRTPLPAKGSATETLFKKAAGLPNAQGSAKQENPKQEWRVGFINALNPLGALGEFQISEVERLPDWE